MYLRKNVCLVLALLSLWALGGCTTMRVTPGMFMHPGYAAMASKALPEINRQGYTATSLFFPAADGVRLHGLLLTRPDARVVVLVYGTAGFQLGTTGVEVAREFESAGVDAFLVEYRGYGQSEGKPTLATLDSDALTAFDYVRQLPQLKGRPMVVFGVSMGSFIASRVALRRPVAGLVLSSTATSVSAFMHNQVPWWSKPFVRIDMDPALNMFNNRKILAAYQGPLLLLDGEKDTLTPPEFAHELFRDAATPASRKMLYISSSQGHAQILHDPDAIRAFDAFVDRKVSGKAHGHVLAGPAWGAGS